MSLFRLLAVTVVLLSGVRPAVSQSQTVVVFGPPLVEYSAVDAADFDGDGVVDLFMTGQLENGNQTTRLYVFNERRVVPRPATSDRIEAHYTSVPFVSRPLFRGSVTWADFNNDGRPDVLATGLSATEVTTNRVDLLSFTDVYLNDSGNRLTINSGTVLPGIHDGQVAVADLNADGFMDVVLAGKTDTGLEFDVFYGDGSGQRFTRSNTDLPPVQATTLNVVDFNVDGRPDLVVGGFNLESQPVLHWFRNDGNDLFTEVLTDVPVRYFNGLVFGDIDGDGDDDVITLGGIPSPGLMRGETALFTNDGAGNFSDESHRLNPFRDVPQLFLGSGEILDKDGDIDLDVLLTGFTGLDTDEQQRLVVLEQIDGQMLNVLDIRSIRNGTVKWFDYDGNGRMDLFLMGRSGGQIIRQLFE